MHACALTEYETYRTTVDRYPGLYTWHTTEANELVLPIADAYTTWGPFSSTTTLPADCFLYNHTSAEDGPIHPNNWPEDSHTTPGPLYYGWFCVTDTSVLDNGDGTTLSFVRDIQPVLARKNLTWADRHAWGMRGFSYHLCRNVDKQWLHTGVPGDPQRTVYSRFDAAPAGTPHYGCIESTIGFFHHGIPMPPNYPDPASYVIPNPSIEYFCINHTVFFPTGNNYNADLTDIDRTQTGPYFKYELTCTARDGFADEYADDDGWSSNLPDTLACADYSPDGSMRKMVESCSLAYLTTDTLPAPPTPFLCTIQCRYPCITHTEYMTFQSQAISSQCAPQARSTQCNRDVRSLSTQFCDPSETMSAFHLVPDAVLNTFENDIVEECSIGCLGCRISCHCKTERGCVNHIKCNRHGTLFDTSIESVPPLPPTCMCEPGRKGDTCEIEVSNVICNHGQEL
jgi:hypothetical protein